MYVIELLHSFTTGPMVGICRDHSATAAYAILICFSSCARCAGSRPFCKDTQLLAMETLSSRQCFVTSAALILCLIRSHRQQNNVQMCAAIETETDLYGWGLAEPVAKLLFIYGSGADMLWCKNWWVCWQHDRQNTKKYIYSSSQFIKLVAISSLLASFRLFMTPDTPVTTTVTGSYSWDEPIWRETIGRGLLAHMTSCCLTAKIVRWPQTHGSGSVFLCGWKFVWLKRKQKNKEKRSCDCDRSMNECLQHCCTAQTVGLVAVLLLWYVKPFIRGNEGIQVMLFLTYHKASASRVAPPCAVWLSGNVINVIFRWKDSLEWLEVT